MRQAGWPIIQPARCEQNKKHLLSQMLFGTAEGIRTPDLLVRSQTLYPTELSAHASFETVVILALFAVVVNIFINLFFTLCKPALPRFRRSAQ